MLNSEDEIRDYLAENISSIEAGLSFIEKESYLPNNLGTRSFIDLVAKDQAGNLVLIELKRSAAASREAIHEVLKYVEAVKKHLAIRDDELRVVVASTDWTELLVPFSKLLEQTSLAISGVLLSVSGSSITGQPVTPLRVQRGRILAPWHDLNYCRSQGQLRRAIKQYEARNRAKGVNDFILLILHSAVGHPSAHEAKVRMLFTGIPMDQQIAPDSENVGDGEIPRYQYILYYSSQMLGEEQYWAILEQDSGSIPTHREAAEGMEDEERLTYLHESVSSMGHQVDRAYFEIGNPAKLQTQLLDQEDWNLWGILRYGSFERNALLSDETIINELCGSEGYTGQRFSRDFSMANKAQVASAKEGIERCLEHNAAWKSAIVRAIEELATDYSDARVEVRIFNPSTGLLTIYHSATKPNGALFIPTYGVTAFQNEIAIRSYMGLLVGNGEPLPLPAILGQFYEGTLRRFLISVTWGGYTSQDSEIVTACGFSYESFRRDFRRDPLQLYRLVHNQWVPIDSFDPLEAYFSHLTSHQDFLDELVQKIAEKDHGGIFEL
jgi:hypothetical protein